MEAVYSKMREMYEQGGKYRKVKLTLKEPKVLDPFIKRSKTNKKYDENGRLVGYTIVKKPKSEYILYLRESNSGHICFSNRLNAKYVYPVWSLVNNDYNLIDKLEFINNDTKKEIDWDTKNRDYIINNTHKNLWKTLVERLKQDDFKDDYLIKENSYGKIKTVSMKSKFPEWVLRNIKNAIENKQNYRYSISGVKRDLSVEIKLTDDGNLFAWYSSEYSGCLNGDYYLLINEKIAVFAEHD